MSKRVIVWCVLFVGIACGRVSGADELRLDRWIERAGNADSDVVRQEVLRELRGQAGLRERDAADLDRLTAHLERWLGEQRLDYFGRDVSRKLDYDFRLSEESVFEELTYLYRGRMVIWYALESGGVWNQAEIRNRYFDAARGYFEKYAEAFPENRIAGMYLGRAIENPKEYGGTAGAPRWAVNQRESLERLADVIEWWIDNRTQEDGQYGGGWGDDCEMWRWWVPVLIGFEDEKISQAQAKFSDALMSQEHMKGGYTTRMSDVEHTAEDSADVITPMMHIDPDNEVWLRRSVRLAELMEEMWTGTNERGMLQYKSTYFTAEKVDGRDDRACDTVYHPRTVQPALLYWQRTGDAKLTRLFAGWMDTWVEATARAERGKAAGIVPSAIHWPDGRIGGTGEDWFNPRNHGEYTLYLWPSAMEMMLDTMLLTYHMTGDEKYLGPVHSMARIRLEYLKGAMTGDAKAGSAKWCAEKMGFVAETIAKYRFLTGDERFDELFAAGMSPYMRLRLEGDRSGLESGLERTVEALRVNYEGYTSEVRYTDRVLRFPTLFGRGMLAEGDRAMHRVDTALLYSAVTGDPGGAGYFPLNAVRWLTRPRDIAALVVDSGRDGFEAEVLHFGDKVREMGAELYLLDEGEYELRVWRQGDGKVLLKRGLTVEGPRKRMSFTLPSRELCGVSVRRVK